jgi:hypothetical protein
VATIEEYARSPDRALIDVLTEPGLAQYVEDADKELLTVTMPDGTQGQVQALSRRSVATFLRRIVEKAQARGVQLEAWMCSPNEFDLCRKLKLPVGERMRQLDAFLGKKGTQGGLSAAGIVVLFAVPGGQVASAALHIFAALGCINNYFVTLCNCTK